MDSPAAPANVYTIQGVHVRFPYKAYPSQISMMDKILQGLKRGQNCLLESPTGSGKSLALLCACLAWLQHEQKLAEQEDLEEASRVVDEYSAVVPPPSLPDYSASTAANVADRPYVVDLTADDEDGDLDDFVVIHKRNRSRNVRPNNESQNQSTLANNSANLPVGSGISEGNSNGYGTTKPKRRIIPKIYFGTRTHRQITQMVHELDKTAYKWIKMVILGSREHTCIHPVVSKSTNKNEMCQELRDPKGGGCSYHTGANKVRSHQTLYSVGLKTPWDIEDLVAVGKKRRICPYYVSRTLKDTTDIIFCPYNYLVDPIIRRTMEINLGNSIVVLDEAHNMEDAARSAASLSITNIQLQAAKMDLEKLATHGYLPIQHNALAGKISQLLDWVLVQSEEMTERSGFTESTKTYAGPDFVAVLTHVGWGPTDYEHIVDLVSTIREVEEDRGKERNPHASSSTSHVLSSLTLILGYLYKNNHMYLDDYRVVVTKEKSFAHNTSGGWFSKKFTGTWIYILNMWCLNPAVAFSDIRDAARAVVLTSGTLSPMESFESELNIPFKIKLEANHVIKSSQVWVGTIGHSEGVSLNGCFRNTERFDYQDQVGKLVLDVCSVTPHGILCFFSSYSMMEKMSTRWQTTGLWNQLERVKVMVCEPRSSQKNEFEDVMTQFYGAIEQSDTSGVCDGGQTGALFLAVCRGKVSEGLDFADSNARAVITIGVPFPNIKGIEVNLKREYNDVNSRKRNLLSGHRWYEIQAFRALNQALGRCIRHRNDWGALILVDDRFGYNNKYTGGLSKWVRKYVQCFPRASDALNSLQNFMDRKQMDQKSADASVNSTLTTTTQEVTIVEDLGDSVGVEVAKTPKDNWLSGTIENYFQPVSAFKANQNLEDRGRKADTRSKMVQKENRDPPSTSSCDKNETNEPEVVNEISTLDRGCTPPLFDEDDDAFVTSNPILPLCSSTPHVSTFTNPSVQSSKRKHGRWLFERIRKRRSPNILNEDEDDDRVFDMSPN